MKLILKLIFFSNDGDLTFRLLLHHEIVKLSLNSCLA